MPFFSYVIYFYLFLSSLSLFAQNRPLAAVPKLYRIGIIAEDKAYPLDIRQSMDHMNQSVSAAVRQSGRFVVLNDELIKKFWKSAHERSELEKEHEISCFFHMSVSYDEEKVTFIARILSTKLEIYLQETDSLDRRSYGLMSYDDIFKATRNLTYKLINRLPVDTYVTSIQGRYVTLSAGSLLGIYPSLELDVYDASIKSLHPATQSWLEFSKEKTGTIKIIESLEKTSVGVIQSATYEGSIKVGQGAKVAESVTRLAFKVTKDPSKDALQVPLNQQEAIIQNKKTDQHQNYSEDMKEASKPKTPHEEMPFDWSLSVGHQMFSLKSKNVEVASKLGALSLINHVNAKMTFLDHENDLDYDLKLLLNFGSTKNSDSYFLKTIEGSFYYTYALKDVSDLFVHYGAKTAFNDYTISAKDTSGSNFIEIALFSEVKYNLTKDVHIGLGADLTPITFGNISINSSKESYKSGFDIGYSLAGVFKNEEYFGQKGQLELSYLVKNLETKQDHVGISFFNLLYQYAF